MRYGKKSLNFFVSCRFIKNNWFLIGCFFTIIVSFFCLQPTLKLIINPSYKEKLTTSFVSQILTQGYVDEQDYWHFREKIGNGTFSFNTNFVDAFQTYRIVNINQEGVTPLFYYSSPNINSVESVTKNQEQLEEIFSQLNIKRSMLLLKTSNTLLFRSKCTFIKTDQDCLNLLFLKPIDSMMNAVGFFDYLPEERELLENSYWFSNTEITLSNKLRNNLLTDSYEKL